MSQVKVLEDLPLFAHVVDRRNRIAWVNRHNAAANGVEPRALVGKRPSEVWPDSASNDEELNRAVRETGKSLSHLAYGKTRTGEAVCLKVTRKPLPGGHVLTVGVDATAEMRGRALKIALAILTDDRKPPAWAGDASAAELLLAGSDEADLEMTLAIGRGDLLERLSRLAG